MSVTPDEYRELCEVARDALYDVLMESEPDTGDTLRRAYRSLKRHIGEEEVDSEREDQQARRQEQWKAELDRKTAWKRLPQDRKEALVLEVLGDDRLSRKALTKRYRAALGPDYTVYEDHVMAVVAKMREAGQVDHEQDPSMPTRKRYLYFRRRGLEGPIAELQRQFDAEDVGGGADADATR